MTLPNGTISMSQVNTEIGRPSTQSINLNDSTVRALAGRPSGSISMSHLRGKSYVTQATGGTIVTLGSTKYHIFTGPGTFSVSLAASPVNYLVVAGGGSAGAADYSWGSAGGGGGGFRAGSTGISATNYPVSVGGGGSSPNTQGTVGVQGSPSSIFGVTSTGGGYGGVTGQNGGPGGSGGGGGSSHGPGYISGPRPGGSGTSGQGNPGGAGYYVASADPSVRILVATGGGGGSAAAGGDRRPPPWTPDYFIGPIWRGGLGGSGSTQPWLPSSLPVGQTSGSYKYFSGGGGGTVGAPGPYIPSYPTPIYNSSISPGGLGGGGTGSGVTNSNPLKSGTPGTTNTGGGGGGGFGANFNFSQGNGGSGVVIVSYPV